jgi:cysteine desulfurase
MLDMMGICASTGSACSSKSLEPSHVLLAMGLPHEIAHGSLRLTLSHETTQADVDYIVECVTKVVNRLREISPLGRN